MEQAIELQAFFSVLMGGCAAVVGIGAAAAVLVKLWRWLRKPAEDNADTLGDHEAWLASDKKRIERLERKQDTADEQNKLMLKALVTLMSHELDGNHTAQLVNVRDEIQNYLIER